MAGPSIRERVGSLFDAISRRYFVSNGFDGTLTSTGVAVGSYLSGVSEGATVVTVGIGAAVGLSTSGVWSVWEIERAEKRIERRDVEAAMLTDLGDTRVQEQNRRDRVKHATMSGIGPLIGILFPISAYLFAPAVITMFEATALAVLIGVLLLFLFGAYMGDISGQSWVVAGLRMGLAGVVVTVINVLLPG
ncbi:VIT1/CCC1 transporter family protein [Halorientalis salina]|uniref:VIT1/CCC1 transporter family protein n=1 Tax=Halorientalis salina TaxID=2932266 RepID=UPI0010AD3CAB|nr:VIT1/CCC1 transporter family protein [Halorientalis salina]